MFSKWQFNIAKHEILITNNWITGMKLYVDGLLKDTNAFPFAIGNHVFLRTELEHLGTLEVIPYAIFTVEISAKLKTAHDHLLVYSSYQKQTLREKRLTQQLAL